MMDERNSYHQVSPLFPEITPENNSFRVGDTSLGLDIPANENDTTEVEGRIAAVEVRTGKLEARSGDLEIRSGELETRVGQLEGHLSVIQATLAGKAEADDTRNELQRLEADKATHAEQAAALEAHDKNKNAHDTLFQHLMMGDISPVIGIVCVETGGGAGFWFNVDGEGQPVSPPKSYFDGHPIYRSIRRVLVDNQVMQEHHKFYYRAFTIASGPFQGKKARVISPGPQDGFKPFPSFMRDGREIDTWYCGTYAATDEGGTPKKLGSRPGKMPIMNVNFSNLKSYCANRNVEGVDGFGMWNIYQVSEMQLLAVLEATTPDTQSAYGSGRVNTSGYAKVDALDVATASWRGHVGLWGNVWQMVDGIDISSQGTVRLWRNDGIQEFVDTGFPCPVHVNFDGFYMKTLKTGSGNFFDFDQIFFPETVTTSPSLGTIPDKFLGCYGKKGNVCYLGSASTGGAGAGFFAQSYFNPATTAGGGVGCRLAKMS